MNKTTLLVLILFLSFLFTSHGQNLSVQSLSAQNASLALCAGSNADEWSTLSNPSGLSSITTIQLAASYQSLFTGTDLSQKAVSLILPVKRSSFGITAIQQGDNNFSTNLYSLTYSQAIGDQLSLGVRFCYHTYLFPEDGESPGTYTVAIGGKSKWKNFSIGIYANNLFHGSIESITHSIKEECLITLNLSYKLSESIDLLCTTYSEDYTSPHIATAFQIKFLKSLFIRAGLKEETMIICGGVGYAFKHYKIDIGTCMHQQLGNSPVFSFRYELPQKRFRK